jgi:hypothetical protein
VHEKVQLVDQPGGEQLAHHGHLVGLALLLARTIDGMNADTKQKMLGQTAGQLVGVLAALRNQAAPKPWSKWDEMGPGVVASRRLGAGTC